MKEQLPHINQMSTLADTGRIRVTKELIAQLKRSLKCLPTLVIAKYRPKPPLNSSLTNK